MPFVERLQQIRIHKAMSQYQLAERAGLSITYIDKLEAGEKIPSCQTLESLAEALDVPIYELFYNGWETPQTPWLTPRPTLEELQRSQQETKPETGLMERVKVLRDELSALLH
ncbi:MAG: helix-turn-helix domain-containing protein [Terriglobia bacterium]